MTLMRYTFIILFIMLASCGWKGAKYSPAWYNNTTEEEKRADFTAQCKKYGFKEGTDAFAECMKDYYTGNF